MSTITDTVRTSLHAHAETIRADGLLDTAAFLMRLQDALTGIRLPDLVGIMAAMPATVERLERRVVPIEAGRHPAKAMRATETPHASAP